MIIGIIGILLLALFLVPVLMVNASRNKENNKETEENK